MRWLAFFLLLSSAFARPSIQVRSEHSSRSAVVRLGDVARLQGFSEAARARIANLKLGSAPMGSPRVMGRAFLKQRITAQVGPGVKLKLPSSLKITRATRGIDSAEIGRRLKAAIKAQVLDPSEIAGIRVQPASALKVAAGAELRFVFRRGERFDGRLTARMEVLEGKRVVTVRGVSAHVDRLHTVYFATRPILRGQSVDLSAIGARRVPGQKVVRGAISDLRQLDEAVAVQNIATGQPLRSNQVKARAVVRRGAKVRVSIERGSFELSVTAIALNDAARGQQVRLRNPSSRKVISATAVADGEARMGGQR